MPTPAAVNNLVPTVADIGSFATWLRHLATIDNSKAAPWPAPFQFTIKHKPLSSL